MVAEYDGEGTLLRRFVHGPGVDEPVALIEPSGAHLFHHADALGSVVALSDDAGQVVERYGYLPYGESFTLGLTPYRFAGRRLDPETGLYYNRHRYDDPDTGRFLSPDPLGPPVDSAPYIYAGNDPVNFRDPDGRAIGDFPPPPPGYNPRTWGYGQWDTG